MSVVADAPPVVISRSAGTGPTVVALAVLAAVAPFDLAVPPDGWSALAVRPLLAVVIAVSVWIIVGQRGRTGVGALEVAVALWLVVAWISTALSDAPLVGAAGAVRLTAFGLLVVATRRAVLTTADAQVVLRGLGIGVVGASVVGLVVLLAGHEMLGTEHFVGSITRLETDQRLTRPWSHANVAGMAIGACLPTLLLFRRAWRVAAVAIVFPALILTYSRGAALAVLAGAIVIIVVRRVRSDARPVAAMLLLGVAVAAASPGWATRLDTPSKQELRAAEIEVPAELRLDPAGITTHVSVSNLSNRTWSAEGADQVELSARWVGEGQDWIWGEHRWALPRDLVPGESADVVVFIDPSIPVGTFVVRWDLVGAGGAHFSSSLGRTTASRGIVVESSVAAIDVEPARLAHPRRLVDRMEIWRLAAETFVDAPLVGVGPSELAVAVEDELGPARRFPGRHAHSLLLEPLATTGLLGAIPLFFVLANGVRRAARLALRSRGLVAIATLAGLSIAVVHGLVDWPLVYSSAAIPIAFLTGIAWTWHEPRRTDAHS